MTDLSPRTFQRFPDPTVLLAALLETLGDDAPVIPVETLERHTTRHDPALEIDLAEHASGGAVLRLVRRDTYAERAAAILTDRLTDPETADTLARDLLAALGADPDRLAP